jgi:outer membrane lipoprotein-sorting protein
VDLSAVALVLLLQPHGQPARKSLEAVLRGYDESRTYEATITTFILKSGQVSSTTIKVKARGDGKGSLLRSRVEIRSDSGKDRSEILRIDDGRSLWTYLPESQRYSRSGRKPEKLSSLFRPFLSSAQAFAVELSARPIRMDGRDLLELKGRGKSGGLLRINLDRATHTLRSADANLPNGDTMVLTVTGQKHNQAIPDSVFRFRIPPGASPLPQARPESIRVPKKQQ